MKRFAIGLVVGKFAPLHRGHESVIRAAIEACDHVVILSYSRPEFPGCEPERRATWLATLFPTTTRIVLDHAGTPLPANDDPADIHRAFCASVLREKTNSPVDAIFTSEDYGPGFAADLARRQGSPAEHVAVDLGRVQVPVSGTELRRDIHGLRHFLSPEVYAGFVKRVALVGGESTGKSTLAAALAEHFGTTYVAEYGRELWEELDGVLKYDDLLKIAREQIRREETALRDPATHRFVFCDSTPLTTLFYSHEMFGRADPELEQLAARTYDHTFLCAADFPFVQDGTRRGESFREIGQEWYLLNHPKGRIGILRGNVEERVCYASSLLTPQILRREMAP
ncbi:AAA family ATPase [Haloferula sargassicola]|uniref:Trifunctional NAD biosynthesis/regulator protein NadR n=1 Tax=Haloferula sargassicola TaxID=490096 RepID=A0ABP9UND6_9BACT